MTAGFEDVVESDDVGFDIGIGIGDAIADTCLGGKVDNDIGRVFGEAILNERFVGDAAFDEDEPTGIGHGMDFCQTLLLQTNIVIVVHIVDAYNLSRGIFIKEQLNEVGTNEPGDTSHEDGAACEIYVYGKHNR